MELEIGSDPAEVGRARGWARARLAGAGIGAREPLAETLVLLVSELVTNAVVHTGRPAVLRLLVPDRQLSEAVRIEVADACGCPPRQRQAEADDACGRGLELVAGLANRWGWQRLGGGKHIWCELDLSAGPVEPVAPLGAGESAEPAEPVQAADPVQTVEYGESVECGGSIESGALARAAGAAGVVGVAAGGTASGTGGAAATFGA